jgi:hypothetical protein
MFFLYLTVNVSFSEVRRTPTLVPPTPELTHVVPSVPQPPEMNYPHDVEEEEEEHLEGVTVVKDVNGKYFD